MRLLEVVAGPNDPARGGRGDRRLRRPPRSARAWCCARTRPASSPTGSAATGCRRRSPPRSRWACRSRRPTRCSGRPLGIPKTGIFGLADLVGIDLLPHVAASLRAALPAGRPVPRGRPRVAADRAADRDRLHRPQGQGRLLPPEPGGRAAGQGGDRPRDRRVSRRRQAAPRVRRRGQGRRAARAVRERRAARRATPGG